MAEERKAFLLKIVTPDRVFLEEPATMVEFNTVEGEVGIYADHIPMTMIIAPGILTITQNDKIRNAALHAGFVEVLQDQVTILAEVIEWPEEINLSRAEKAKKRAEERISAKQKGIDLDRADLALRRAVARIETLSGKRH